MILYNNDCMEILPKLADQSIDLIVIDPPYNIGKAEWDKIDNYIEWLGNIFVELERVLKDTGSFYFFHNDYPQMAELQNYIDKHTDFKFKQLIVWNKKFKGSNIENFADHHININRLRNYQNFTEYCLFYVKQGDKTGLQQIMRGMGTDNFPTLRNYFKNLHKWIGVPKVEIINTIGGKADHVFRHSSIQWEMCTESTYNELDDYYNITEYPNYKPFKEVQRLYNEYIDKYEQIRIELEEANRYTFNNQKTHHSVWNYDVAEKWGHITPKPVPLLENILKHSSNPGDVVLDCFMGSGSTGVACKNLDREFVGIEIDREYFKIAKERCLNESN